MPKLSVPSRRLLRWIPALTLGVLLLLAACAPEQYPQTTLLPRANTARDQDHLFRLTLWWALVVFVLVEGALLIAIWKFRSRPDAPEPVQTHGNTTLEIVWTIIPAFILAMIAVPTVRTIFKTAAKPDDGSGKIGPVRRKGGEPEDAPTKIEPPPLPPREAFGPPALGPQVALGGDPKNPTDPYREEGAPTKVEQPPLPPKELIGPPAEPKPALGPTTPLGGSAAGWIRD